MNNYKPNQKVRIVTVQLAIPADALAIDETREVESLLRRSMLPLMNAFPDIFLDHKLDMGNKDNIIKLSGAVDDGDAFLLNDLRIENAKRRIKACGNCANIDQQENCPKCGGCAHNCTCGSKREEY